MLASLAFSTRRLSEAAQKALPWLGLFSGGVFEEILLDVSQIPSAEWDAVRAELEATALIRVEREMQINDRPYLRFHPTLAHAASSFGVPALAGGASDEQERLGSADAPSPKDGTPNEIRGRFIAVYLPLAEEVNNALFGSHPRWGMEILAREQANYLTAVRWAVADRAYDVASDLGDTLREYLERNNRLRERNALVSWLAGEVGKSGFTNALADRELDVAWSLAAQGHAQEALQKLRALIARLRHTIEFDPAFQLANTQTILGRVLVDSGLSEQAIPVLEEAKRQWVALVEKKAGPDVVAVDVSPRTSKPEEISADSRRRLQAAETELGNLSVTLGDLANALRTAGRLEEALEAGEKRLPIEAGLGREREVASSHGQCASILLNQGRYAEADARYDLALAAARRAGDKELEGSLLQHQGGLAYYQNQLDRAASLYQRALKLFQEANDDGSIMRTCNLLGVVEQSSGRLAEARTWCERSREIAQRLGDTRSLGAAAQNIGIVCQQEGEAARQRGDEKTARQRFEEAKRSFKEANRIDCEQGNQPYEAQSCNQLAQVHLQLGELAEAERHAHQAREVNERLGLLQELQKNFGVLALIARARGDAAQAAEWERKRDAVLAELERRAQGPGGGGLTPQFAQAIQQLAIAYAQAGFDEPQPQELAPGAESALAQIEQLPAPLPDLAAFLRRLAARELPSVPANLPPELQELLGQLLHACREAARSAP